MDCDKSSNRLPFDLVGPSNDGRFSHIRVIDQRALDFHRADPMTSDVKYVVHPAEQPKVAISIQLGTVTCEVRTVSPLAPVLLNEPIRVAVDPA